MRYARVYLDAIDYELPAQVITSEELEDSLQPVYERLHLSKGQLEALTGISERRWWAPGFAVADGAVDAARKTIQRAMVRPKDIQVLIYGGVCREQFEPATACRVAAALGVPEEAAVYDVSNACLGILNGMVEIANRIELGQIRAGLVVSSESARELVEASIQQLCRTPSMELFRTSLATLTGGSGAVSVLLTDGSFSTSPHRRMLGGVARTAPHHHQLCRWGIERNGTEALQHVTSTDAGGILKHGVQLGLKTWNSFLKELNWHADEVDRIICHQVVAPHRETILHYIDVSEERDFPTYPYLGNMGTVSLPLSAALAAEREFLQPGQHVGFLGIASGLNCMMLGIEW